MSSVILNKKKDANIYTKTDKNAFLNEKAEVEKIDPLIKGR